MPLDLPSDVFAHPLLAGRGWTLVRHISGRHSELMEFREGSRRHRIFIKRLHDSGRDGYDARLRREYRALCALHGRADPLLARTIPAPFLTADAGNVLVVGGVDGVPLTRVLKRDANLLTGSLFTRWLRVSGEAVGCWLRRFHEVTARPPMRHDHERFCHQLDAAVERVRTRTGAHGLSEVRERLTRLSGQLAGTLLEAAAGHGDFLPQNVLIGADGAAVVDFEGYRHREVVYRDYAAMLTYTMILERQPAYRASAVRAFAAAFGRAYGRPLRSDALRLFTAEAALRIARDSANHRTHRIMTDIVPPLLSEASPLHPAWNP